MPLRDFLSTFVKVSCIILVVDSHMTGVNFSGDNFVVMLNNLNRIWYFGSSSSIVYNVVATTLVL